MNAQTTTATKVSIIGKHIASATVAPIVTDIQIFEHSKKAYSGSVTFSLFDSEYTADFSATKVENVLEPSKPAIYQPVVSNMVDGNKKAVGVDYYMLAIDVVRSALAANDAAIVKEKAAFANYNSMSLEAQYKANQRARGGHGSYWS